MDMDYADVQAAFKKFDSNGDGRIDAAEVRRCVEETIGLSLKTKEACGLIRLYDTSGTGDLDMDEFSDLLKNVSADMDPKKIVQGWVAAHGGALSDKVMRHLMKAKEIDTDHRKPDEKVLLSNFPVDPNDYDPFIMSDEEFEARTIMSQSLQRRDYAEVFRLVDEVNADPDWEDAYGKTPLIEAARNGLRVVIGELFERGAEGDYENQYGETALSVAAKAGFAHCLDYMTFDEWGNKRCTVSFINMHGKTAVDYATANGHVHMLDKLEEAELRQTSLSDDMMDGAKSIGGGAVGGMKKVGWLLMPNRFKIKWRKFAAKRQKAQLEGKSDAWSEMLKEDARLQKAKNDKKNKGQKERRERILSQLDDASSAAATAQRLKKRKGIIKRRMEAAKRKLDKNMKQLKRTVAEPLKNAKKEAAKREAGALKIQHCYKTYISLVRFRVAVASLLRSQRLEAGRKIKELKYAVMLQSKMRMHLTRNQFRRRRKRENAACVIQNAWHNYLFECQEIQLRWHAARLVKMERVAIMVQRWFRGSVARQVYEGTLQRSEAAIIIQCNYRRWRAERDLAMEKWMRKSEAELARLRVSTLEISRIAMVSQLKHEMQAVPIIQRLVRRVILDKHFVVLKGIAGQQIALNKGAADKAIISLQRIFRGRRGREHAAVMRVLRAKRLGLLEDCLSVRGLATIGQKKQVASPSAYGYCGKCDCSKFTRTNAGGLHVCKCGHYITQHAIGCVRDPLANDYYDPDQKQKVSTKTTFSMELGSVSEMDLRNAFRSVRNAKVQPDDEPRVVLKEHQTIFSDNQRKLAQERRLKDEDAKRLAKGRERAKRIFATVEKRVQRDAAVKEEQRKRQQDARELVEEEARLERELRWQREAANREQNRERAQYQRQLTKARHGVRKATNQGRSTRMRMIRQGARTRTKKQRDLLVEDGDDLRGITDRAVEAARRRNDAMQIDDGTHKDGKDGQLRPTESPSSMNHIGAVVDSPLVEENRALRGGEDTPSQSLAAASLATMSEKPRMRRVGGPKKSKAKKKTKAAKPDKAQDRIDLEGERSYGQAQGRPEDITETYDTMNIERLVKLALGIDEAIHGGNKGNEGNIDSTGNKGNTGNTGNKVTSGVIREKSLAVPTRDLDLEYNAAVKPLTPPRARLPPPPPAPRAPALPLEEAKDHAPRLWLLPGANAEPGAFDGVPNCIEITKSTFTVGRGSYCDAAFDSSIRPKLISKLHATLHVGTSLNGTPMLEVTDRGSTNGTYVDGNKVFERTALPHGTRVIFGGMPGAEGKRSGSEIIFMVDVPTREAPLLPEADRLIPAAVVPRKTVLPRLGVVRCLSRGTSRVDAHLSKLWPASVHWQVDRAKGEKGENRWSYSREASPLSPSQHLPAIQGPM